MSSVFSMKMDPALNLRISEISFYRYADELVISQSTVKCDTWLCFSRSTAHHLPKHTIPP